MRKSFKKIHGAYFCDKDCELCEGKAYVITGDAVKFNVSLMEIQHADEKSPCPNSEFIEKDYPDRRGE